MSGKTLIKWRDNYADEFDVHGWEVASNPDSEDERQAWRREFVNYFKEESQLEHCVGTNEFIPYDSVGEVMSKLSFISITERQAEFLEGTFGKRYGFSLPRA